MLMNVQYVKLSKRMDNYRCIFGDKLSAFCEASVFETRVSRTKPMAESKYGM